MENVQEEFNKIAKLYALLPFNYTLAEVEKVYEANPEWISRVVNEDYKLLDVLHDFRGILSNDEHFVPRL